MAATGNVVGRPKDRKTLSIHKRVLDKLDDTKISLFSSLTRRAQGINSKHLIEPELEVRFKFKEEDLKKSNTPFEAMLFETLIGKLKASGDYDYHVTKTFEAAEELRPELTKFVNADDVLKSIRSKTKSNFFMARKTTLRSINNLYGPPTPVSYLEKGSVMVDGEPRLEFFDQSVHIGSGIFVRYTVSAALSLESRSAYTEQQVVPTTGRYKTRMSFVPKGEKFFRIDLTHAVQYTLDSSGRPSLNKFGESNYEVEIEYFPHSALTSADRVKNFMKPVKIVIEAMETASPSPSSVLKSTLSHVTSASAYREIQSEIDRLVKLVKVGDPREYVSLDVRGGMNSFGRAIPNAVDVSNIKPQKFNLDKPYAAGYKLDGVRSFGFVTTDSVYVITTRSVESYMLSSAGNNMNGTIFEGEMYESSDGSRGVHVFDVISFRGINTTSYPFNMRQNQIQEIVTTINTKLDSGGYNIEFVSKLFNQTNSTIYNVRAAIEEVRDLTSKGVKLDGIILTPIAPKYSEAVSIKWKPINQLTVDLAIDIDAIDEKIVTFNLYGSERTKQVLFEYENVPLKFECVKGSDEHKAIVEGMKGTGSRRLVCEFLFHPRFAARGKECGIEDYVGGKLEFIRIRSDKEFPNNVENVVRPVLNELVARTCAMNIRNIDVETEFAQGIVSRIEEYEGDLKKIKFGLLATRQARCTETGTYSPGLEMDAEVYQEALLARHGVSEDDVLIIPDYVSKKSEDEKKSILDTITKCNVLFGFETMGDETILKHLSSLGKNKPYLVWVPNFEVLEKEYKWKSTIEHAHLIDCIVCKDESLVKFAEEFVARELRGVRGPREPKRPEIVVVSHQISDKHLPVPLEDLLDAERGDEKDGFVANVWGRGRDERKGIIHFAGCSPWKNTLENVKAGIYLIQSNPTLFDKFRIFITRRPDDRTGKQRLAIPDDDMKKINDLVESSGARDKIELTVSGFVSEKEKFDAYSRSIVALCCSEAEGFGYYIQEAAYSGCVVVTTEGVPMKHVLQNTFITVKPVSVKHLSYSLAYSVDARDISDAILSHPDTSTLIHNRSRETTKRIIENVSTRRKMFIDEFNAFVTNILDKNTDLRVTRHRRDAVRVFNNDVKRILVERFIPVDATILDIGIGRGGDLDKYAKRGAARVDGIEPNDENIDELVKRYRNNSRANFTLRVAQSGYSTSALANLVKNYAGINSFRNDGTMIKSERYDSVCMFFSMSFFFSSEQRLRELLLGIYSTLKDGGGKYYICTFMDGDELTERLRAHSQRPEFKVEVDGSGSIKKAIMNDNRVEIGFRRPVPRIVEAGSEPRVFGQDITFVYKSSETVSQVQREYLVSYKTLRAVAMECGLVLAETKMFTDETLAAGTMTPGEWTFAGVNRYCVFVPSRDHVFDGAPGPSDLKFSAVPVIEENNRKSRIERGREDTVLGFDVDRRVQRDAALDENVSRRKDDHDLDHTVLYRSEDAERKYAFVTLVMKGDAYIPGALVTAYTALESVRESKMSRDIGMVCMVTEDVSDRAIDALKSVYTEIVRVPYLRFRTDASSLGTDKARDIYENWMNESYTKWNCLRLERYDKIVFLDADLAAVNKNISELFRARTPAAPFGSVWASKDGLGLKTGATVGVTKLRGVVNAKKGGGVYGMTASVVVLSPSKRMFDDYVLAMKEWSSNGEGFHGGFSTNMVDEKSFMKFVLEKGERKFYAISHEYNAIPWKLDIYDKYTRGKKFVPKIFHYFNKDKPWSFDIASRPEYSDVYLWWWYAYNLVISTQNEQQRLSVLSSLGLRSGIDGSVFEREEAKAFISEHDKLLA